MKFKPDCLILKSVASRFLSLFILLLLFGFLPSRVFAQDKSVRIETEEVGDSVRIIAYNGKPYSITMSVNVSGRNFKSSQKLPAKLILAPKSHKVALFLDKRNKSMDFEISVSSKWIAGNVNARHDDSYVYRLPYRRNQSFRVGQSHDGSFSHTGNGRYSIDFMMPTGTIIIAAREGMVARIEEKNFEGGPSDEFKNKANYIYIEHEDGTFAEYTHLKQNGVLVNLGDRVQKGQVIGLSGNTGFSSGPHLHFSVSKVILEGNYKSVPVKVKTSKGILVRLQEGVEYTYK